MKKKILILIILIFFVNANFVIYKYFFSDDYKKFHILETKITTTNAMYENKKYQDSLNEVNKIINDLSGNSYQNYIQLNKGMTLFQMGDYDNSLVALNQFETFVADNENNKKISDVNELKYKLNLYKGLVLLKMNLFTQSEVYIDRAMKNSVFNSIKPNEKYEIQYQYAYNLSMLDKSTESVKVLESLINKTDISNEIKTLSLNLLGSLYKDKVGDEDKSLSYYNESLSLQKDPEVLFQIIELQILKEKNEEALNLTNDLITLAESEGNKFDKLDIAYAYQGILLYKTHDYITSLYSFKNAEKTLKTINQPDRKVYYTTVEMYLLFIYYNLKEYKLAYDVIDEINNSTDFTTDMKNTANKYKGNIDQVMQFTTNMSQTTNGLKEDKKDTAIQNPVSNTQTNNIDKKNP